MCRAVLTGKPVTLMLEPDQRKGGLFLDDALNALEAALSTMLPKWGLDKEIATVLEGCVGANMVRAADGTAADHRAPR